jgi:carbonic anhydrase/acetyltransferase-like protein (isoleucine patch superfamily)
MDFKESLVPDLANPPRVRRKRAPKHDFKDGQGRVFAHRHANGGGWVADTARVADSVRVTRNAQVAQYARIEDECALEGRAFVTGHARISGNVRLLQDARVEGHARVFDRARLTGSARVIENASVGGSSLLENRALVSGWAYVLNSRINGPRWNFESTISGNARVFDSNIWGACWITESALLQRTTVNNAHVCRTARAIDSNLATILVSQVWSAINNRAGPLLPEPLANYLCAFNGTFLRSNLSMPVVTIEEQAMFINCHIGFNQLSIPRISGLLYLDLNVRDEGMFLAYRPPNGTIQTPNIPQAVQPASPIPAIASVGRVHSPDTIRQRRIMRLERSEQ